MDLCAKGRPAKGELSGFEHVIGLSSSTWGFLAAVHIQFLLAFGDIRQGRAKPLVFDNCTLIDLL